MIDRTAIIDGMQFNFKSGHTSQFVLKEVMIDWCYDFNFDRGNDVVLNMGGHWGAFDLFASPKVRKIITFEPEEEAYLKLQEHIILNDLKNVRTYNGAVVNNDKTQTELYLLGSGHNSVQVQESVIATKKVNAYNIQDILKAHPFTKIKCDIEGGERDFIDIVRPETVNEMYFEVHFNKIQDKKDYIKFKENLTSQSFSYDEIDNDTGLDRTLLLHCKR